MRLFRNPDQRTFCPLLLDHRASIHFFKDCNENQRCDPLYISPIRSDNRQPSRPLTRPTSPVPIRTATNPAEVKIKTPSSQSANTKARRQRLALEPWHRTEIFGPQSQAINKKTMTLSSKNVQTRRLNLTLYPSLHLTAILTLSYDHSHPAQAAQYKLLGIPSDQDADTYQTSPPSLHAVPAQPKDSVLHYLLTHSGAPLLRELGCRNGSSPSIQPTSLKDAS